MCFGRMEYESVRFLDLIKTWAVELFQVLADVGYPIEAPNYAETNSNINILRKNSI
jgi:hypothetical protein